MIKLTFGEITLYKFLLNNFSFNEIQEYLDSDKSGAYDNMAEYHKQQKLLKKSNTEIVYSDEFLK